MKSKVVKMTTKQPSLAIQIAEARGAVRVMKEMHDNACDYLGEAKRELKKAKVEVAKRENQEFYCSAGLESAEEGLVDLIEAAA